MKSEKITYTTQCFVPSHERTLVVFAALSYGIFRKRRTDVFVAPFTRYVGLVELQLLRSLNKKTTALACPAKANLFSEIAARRLRRRVFTHCCKLVKRLQSL